MNCPRSSATWLALVCALALAAPARAKLSKGDPAPPFELDDVKGGRVSSASLAEGGLTILAFVALDSKPSRELTLALGDLDKKHGKQGLRVVVVAGDPADALKTFATQHDLGFSVCADTSRETVRRYGADQIVPMTYLLAPDGTVAEVIPGGGMAAQQMLLGVAEKEFARGNTRTASALYEEVAKDDPKNATARAGLGFALAKEGKLERAEEEFKTLGAAGGAAAATAAEGMADVRLRRGDLDGAVAAVARAPDSAYAHVIRGEVAARRGQLDDAKREFQTASAKPAKLSWQSGMAFNNLANVSRAKGDANAAVTGYDKAIAAEPFLVEARSNKGATLEKLGRRDEARKTLAAARSLAPQDQLVATLLRNLEEQEKAKVDLERQKLADKLVSELVATYRSGKPPPAPEDDWAPRALVVSLIDFQSRLGPLAREGLTEAFVLNLGRRLQESGRIQVVEREIIDKLLAELKLGSSELANPATRLKLGRVLAARVIGTGGLYPVESRIQLQLRLVDSETTDIRATLSEELASPAEVSTFAERIADRITQTLRTSYPLRSKIASVEGDEIIVGLGRKHGAQAGVRVSVVEDGQAIEVDGEVLGHRQKEVGKLELTRIEDGFSYAKPVSGSGFKKGQHVLETLAR